MMEDARDISSCFILTNAGKDIERSGKRISDHATGIAGMVTCMERGHDVRHMNNEATTELLTGEKM